MNEKLFLTKEMFSSSSENRKKYCLYKEYMVICHKQFFVLNSKYFTIALISTLNIISPLVLIIYLTIKLCSFHLIYFKINFFFRIDSVETIFIYVFIICKFFDLVCLYNMWYFQSPFYFFRTWKTEKLVLFWINK